MTRRSSVCIPGRSFSAMKYWKPLASEPWMRFLPKVSLLSEELSRVRLAGNSETIESGSHGDSIWRCGG